jgi:hypothetical protein
VTKTVRKWSFEERIGEFDDVIGGLVVVEVWVAESVDKGRSVDVESAILGREFAKLVNVMASTARFRQRGV